MQVSSKSIGARWPPFGRALCSLARRTNEARASNWAQTETGAKGRLWRAAILSHSQLVSVFGVPFLLSVVLLLLLGVRWTEKSANLHINQRGFTRWLDFAKLCS